MGALKVAVTGKALNFCRWHVELVNNPGRVQMWQTYCVSLEASVPRVNGVVLRQGLLHAVTVSHERHAFHSVRKTYGSTFTVEWHLVVVAVQCQM